ncbi:MAG: fimbrillin family protein [Rikenellaceae bacterium]
MKRLIYISAILLVLAGCSKSKSKSDGDTSESNTLDGYTQSTTPIAFQTALNWGDDQTRGIETTSLNFYEFGLFGYFIDNGDEDAIESLTPNFMYNQQVSYSSSTKLWSYSPIKYWSNDDNDRIQFFGYHPYNSEDIELSANNAVGYPTFTVTPHANPYDQDDFVVASTEPLGNDTESVSLSFTHKLAQARIYAAHCGDQSATVNIMNITISGYRGSGTCTYDATEKGFVWEHQQGTETVPADKDKATYYLDETEINTNISGGIANLGSATVNIDDYTLLDLSLGKSYMMLIPQDEIGELKFTVLFSYTLSSSTVQAFQELTLASGSTLVENEIKYYLLLIDPEDVGFGSITVTSEPWIDVDIDNTDNDGVYQIE